MAHKSQQQHPGDDWAGLAQNLFGINLDKPKSGDDDLLDDDMFKVELPKPPAPPPVVVTTAAQPVAQDEIEFAPAEPAVPAAAAQAPTRTATAAAANRPTSTKAALPPQKAAVVAPKSDSFGAGLDDFGFGVVETNQTSHLVEEDDDDGLTLPEDYDSEGLTLPSDYDDGLTLAPEALSDDECDEDEEDDEEFEDDDSDDEELSADEDFEDDDEASDESDADDEAEAGAETSISGQASAAPASSDAPRPKRPFRRTREDAYWDMLENWEWEEIPASDAPRADGGRSSSGGRGRDRDRDRKGSGSRGASDRGRRGDRPREDRPPTEQRDRSPDRPTDRPAASDRPTTADRSAASDKSVADDHVREQRPQSEDRSRSTERPPTGTPRGRSAEGSGDRSRPPRDDRSRQERPRDEKPREDRPRTDTRAPASPSPAARPSAAPQNEQSSFDDFGLGVFESEPTPIVSRPSASERRPREETVAQSSVAADKILRSSNHQPAKSRTAQIEEELVWPEADDSDVRLVSAGSISETTAIPSAGAADESDEESDESAEEFAEDSSDITELNEDGTPRRPRRRRRRRGRRRTGEGTAETSSEGTTFDLNDALSGASDTADFIPASASEDGSLADADEPDDEANESDESSERSDDDQPAERKGRRRRRRRRRPTDANSTNAEGEPIETLAAVDHSDSNVDQTVESHLDLEHVTDDEADDEEEVAVIRYAKMPSWEEAIRYLLNPHLVGKNLDPEDEAESLVGDPRGSGGSEPVPVAPQRRFRRGGSSSGGGRGRRPDTR